MSPSAPAVFVSYSHDSQEHKQWVIELATRLRNSGVDAILDQWELGPGGDLASFMEASIKRASRVLMICSERYVEKANAGVGGVGYEKMIVTAALIKNIGSNRTIPIIRQTNSWDVPTFLGSKVYIDLSTDDRFETGMDLLLREIHGAPLFEKPPIGDVPFADVKASIVPAAPSPMTQFMLAIRDNYDKSGPYGALSLMLIRETMNTSKLFFDFALDEALKVGYVQTEANRRTVFATERGRQFMMHLGDGSISS